MENQLYTLWDIESVNVPRGYDTDFIVPCIIEMLHSLHYSGSFAIEAVVAKFSEDRIPERIRSKLEEQGVKFTALGTDDKQAADDEIIRRMKKWSEQCSQGVLILLTCDGDFATTMHSIRTRSPNLHTILIYIPSSLRGQVFFYPRTGRHTLQSVLSRKTHPLVIGNAGTGAVVGDTTGCAVVKGIESIVWARRLACGSVDWPVRGEGGGLLSGSGGLQSGRLQIGIEGLQRGIEGGGLQSGRGDERLQSGREGGGLQSGRGDERLQSGRGGGGLQSWVSGRGGGGLQSWGSGRGGGGTSFWRRKDGGT